MTPTNVLKCWFYWAIWKDGIPCAKLGDGIMGKTSRSYTVIVELVGISMDNDGHFLRGKIKSSCEVPAQAFPSPTRTRRATFIMAITTQIRTASVETNQLFLILTPSASASFPSPLASPVRTVMYRLRQVK